MYKNLAKHQKCLVHWPAGVPHTPPPRPDAATRSSLKGVAASLSPLQRDNLHAAVCVRKQLRIIDWVPIPDDQRDRVPGDKAKDATHIVIITMPITPHDGDSLRSELKEYAGTVRVVTNNGISIGATMEVTHLCHTLQLPYRFQLKSAGNDLSIAGSNTTRGKRKHSTEADAGAEVEAEAEDDGERKQPKVDNADVASVKQGQAKIPDSKRKRQPDDQDGVSTTKKRKTAKHVSQSDVDPLLQAAIKAAQWHQLYPARYEVDVATALERSPKTAAERKALFKLWAKMEQFKGPAKNPAKILTKKPRSTSPAYFLADIPLTLP